MSALVEPRELDDLATVDGVIQRLTYAHVVERRLGWVQPEVFVTRAGSAAAAAAMSAPRKRDRMG